MNVPDLPIERIKRLRAVAHGDRKKGDGLRVLATDAQTQADRLAADADRAYRMASGWHKMADELFAATIVGDPAAALAELTERQRKGVACYVCGGEISEDAPDERLGVLDDTPVFAHVDDAVCERVRAERAAAAPEGEAGR